MPGKLNLQLLRTDDITRKSSTETLLEAQPLFVTDTNKLYIGKIKTGTTLTPVKELLPVVAEQLVSPNDSNTIGVKNDRIYIDADAGNGEISIQANSDIWIESEGGSVYIQTNKGQLALDDNKLDIDYLDSQIYIEKLGASEIPTITFNTTDLIQNVEGKLFLVTNYNTVSGSYTNTVQMDSKELLLKTVNDSYIHLQGDSTDTNSIFIGNAMASDDFSYNISIESTGGIKHYNSTADENKGIVLQTNYIDEENAQTYNNIINIGSYIDIQSQNGLQIRNVGSGNLVLSNEFGNVVVTSGSGNISIGKTATSGRVKCNSAPISGEDIIRYKDIIGNSYLSGENGIRSTYWMDEHISGTKTPYSLYVSDSDNAPSSFDSNTIYFITE